MTELVPADWIVAHRCVDLSADFGSDDLERLIAAARPQENALASMEARLTPLLEEFGVGNYFTFDGAVVERLFLRNREVALASPELRPWGRRDKGETLTAFWTRGRETLAALRAQYPGRRMMICAKFPDLAQRFFNA